MQTLTVGQTKAIPYRTTKIIYACKYKQGTMEWSREVDKHYLFLKKLMLKAQAYVFQGYLSYHEAIREVEQEFLIFALGLFGNNIRGVSKFLNMPHNSISTKLERFGISRVQDANKTTFTYWSYIPTIGATGR